MRLDQLHPMLPNGSTIPQQNAQSPVTVSSTSYLTDGRNGYQVDGIAPVAMRKLFSSSGPLASVREKWHIVDVGSFSELFDKHQRFHFQTVQEFLNHIQSK